MMITLTAGWILDYGNGSFILLLTHMVPTFIIIYAVIHLFLFIIRRSIAHSLNSHLNK